MKFENTKVYNIARAVYSARNAMNSWDKSDSDLEKDILGKNDLELAQKLIKAGSEHRKCLRSMFVSVDITAPLYWWKEFDTYKVGTVSNSCSTMHKLASTPITRDCFEMGDFQKNLHCELRVGEGQIKEILGLDAEDLWERLIGSLEYLRQKYNKTKDKRYWKVLIQMLPESWLQKRTITMNYENVLNMYQQRCIHPHKLTEWSVDFANWVKTLPYAKEFFGAE